MKTVNGTYGSNRTECTVFTYRRWYVCKGSVNVNRTHDDIEDGVNVEELNDYDIFTAFKPINTLN